MRKREIERKFDRLWRSPRWINSLIGRSSISARACKCDWPSPWLPQLEPEILLVDEVLAVGDLEFQKKCLGK